MKKILCVFSMVGLLFSNSFPAQEKIRLEQAVADGIAMNQAYANTLLDKETAALEEDQARKNRLFQVEAGGDYFYRSATMQIEIPGVEVPGLISVPGKSLEAGVHHNFDLKMGVYQPIYTGGRLTGSLKLREIQKAVADNQARLQKLEIAGQIKTVFFDYLVLDKSLESLTHLKDKLNIHLAKAEDLRQEGLIGKIDVLETRRRIDEIDLRIEDVSQAIAAQRIRFRRLCGHYPEDIDRAYTEEAEPLKASLDYFRTHHPAYLTLQKRMDLLAAQKKIASAQTLPQVSGFGEVHYGKPGIDFFQKEWMLYFQGGITVNWTLFNWGKAEAEKEVLDLDIQKIRNQSELFLNDIRENLEKLYQLKRTLENKIALAEEMIENTREEAGIKADLYRERRLPNRDYLAALEALEQAEVFEEELRCRLEQVNIRINTLIGREES